MHIFPIILAAGQGTRMRSSLPKVLHPIAGKPMLQHVIEACEQTGSNKVAVVYGHGGDQVQAAITDQHILWVQQKEQKGTGHAVAQTTSVMEDDDVVVVAYGDVPLIKAETLRQLADLQEDVDLCVLTTMLDNPMGYGRIVRDKSGRVVSIVEEKDADAQIRNIKEVNTGFIAARGKDLKRWLKQLSPDNAQGEYYLTDCIELAAKENGNVQAIICKDPDEVQGVNNRQQQAELERVWQARKAEQLMEDGVTLSDPSRIDVRGTLSTGRDVTIDFNVLFLGDVVLGDGVSIEPGCVIKDSFIASGVTIKANSVIESAQICENCDIGPFARIRPDTVIKSGAKVGNFVEIKKSTIGKGSKVSHLSYIGDTQMGGDVNVGAGTITCNYDGANKFITTIGDNVFIGSCTQLVAPVTIDNDATIGAGSTITKDTPAGELTLARAKQITIKGWVRPKKKK
jgi:bifunctional UDP-N-acetylglucosamine pyrophosphorylase/glucosamine-1-phosphate N-acetyltransferase